MALALGEWNVDEMMDDMSATLMDEWKAFFSLEPFGSFEDEFRFSQIVAVIANANRDEKIQKNPFKVTDFMRQVFVDEIEKDDLTQKMSNIFSSLGANRLPGT